MDKFFDAMSDFESVNETEINKCKNDITECCDDLSNHLLFEGMITCSKCNSIVTNIIQLPEWRFYGSNDTKSSDPTRCGMPENVLLPESSIGTSISYRNNSMKMARLRKYQRWNGIPYKERSLLKVFEGISRTCNKANISKKIINESNSLYKIISITKISRGSNRKGIIAACVYFSCKINGVPRSPNEIAEIFGLSIPIMTKGCKKFQEIMQMNKVDINRIHIADTINMDDFIDRFCSKLNLSLDDIIIIKDISKMTQLYNLVNENTPPSMAAGCIYLYVKNENISITKKDISLVCKISEVTINKCFKKLEPHINKLII